MPDDAKLPGEAKAPKSIRLFGYAVLFLFSIASAILSNLHGAPLPRIILLCFLLIFFMLGLYSFDRISRSDEPRWRTLGFVFSIITMSLIVLTASSVICFMVTGHPKSIGAILGDQAPAAPSAAKTAAAPGKAPELHAMAEANAKFDDLRASIGDHDFYKMGAEGCFPFAPDSAAQVALPKPVLDGILTKAVGDPDDYKSNPDGPSEGGIIQVVGLTEYVGTREYDLALGARRANAIRDFLVTLGFPAAKIETVSFGRERGTDTFGPYFCGALICRKNPGDEGACALPGAFAQYQKDYGPK